MYASIHWQGRGLLLQKLSRTVRAKYPDQYRLLRRFRQQISSQMGIYETAEQLANRWIKNLKKESTVPALNQALSKQALMAAHCQNSIKNSLKRPLHTFENRPDHLLPHRPCATCT
jgi:hypothetical protein